MKRQLFFLVIVAVLLALSACTASQVAEPVGQIEQAGATSTSLPTNPPPTATLVPTPFPTPAPRLDELVMAAMGGWNSDEIGADQIDLTISYFADAAVFEMIGFPPDMPSRFVGREAIRAAYESWLPLHPIRFLTPPYWLGMWFGLYATWEGIVLQVMAGAFVIGSYFVAENMQKRTIKQRAQRNSGAVQGAASP